MSKIEWTNKTWNPIIGCSKISPGCDNCYAEKMAYRLMHMPYTSHYQFVLDDNGEEDPEKFKNIPKWNGTTFYCEDQIYKPLRWRKPSKVFIISMGDLFHEKTSFEVIDKVMAIIAVSPKHTFQILTKRPHIMYQYFNQEIEKLVERWVNASYDLGICDKNEDTDSAACYINNRCYGHTEKSTTGWPLTNLWLGVTVEDQLRANKRIPLLLEIPAKVRFVSCEPLLGPIDFYEIIMHGEFYNTLGGFGDISGSQGIKGFNKIDWVIAGGETGHNARPMHPNWIYDIQRQCEKHKTPFFFKQWGEYRPFIQTAQPPFYKDVASNKEYDSHGLNFIDPETAEMGKWATFKWLDYMEIDDCMFLKTGRKIAGNRLFGKKYQQFPNP